MSQAWAGKPRPACGAGQGAPWVLCFSFGSGCTLSGTGMGALAWRGLSRQEGACMLREVRAAILWASLGQAQRQLSPEGWRQEGASPLSAAHCTHVLLRFGVSHPRERLVACPGCCGKDRLPPRAGVAGMGPHTCRWVECCWVLPVPASSKGCAAFCISSSHCHSNRLGAWVPAMPAPTSRTAILPMALTAGPQALPAQHSEASMSQPGVLGGLAPGDGCLQCHASIPLWDPAQDQEGWGGLGALSPSEPSEDNIS